MDNKANNETVLLVDVSYLFKSHFSASTTVTTQGVPVGGITGVINKIPPLVSKFNVDVVCMCFDGVDSRKRRRKIFERYKFNRDESSNITSKFDIESSSLKDLEKLQLQVLYELVGLLPFKRLYFKELEADDIIGYLSKTYYKYYEGQRIIVSEDKDYYQLIDENTSVYHPRKDFFVHYENFREVWDTVPENVIYYRTIEGDSSDNITGVKGWGTKTIEKFFPELKSLKIDSIDNFIELIESKRAELLKSKTGCKLLNQSEVIPDNYMLMDLTKTMLSSNERIILQKVMKKNTKNLFNDILKFKNRCSELNLTSELHNKNIQTIYNRLRY